MKRPVSTIHKRRKVVEIKAFKDNPNLRRGKLKPGEHITINLEHDTTTVIPGPIDHRGTYRHNNFKTEGKHRLRKSITLILPNRRLIITHNEWKGIVKSDDNKKIRHRLEQKIINVVN